MSISRSELAIVGDLGGTYSRVGVAGPEGLIDCEILPTPQKDGDALFQQLGQQALRFLEEYEGIRLGVFGVPGPVDRRLGRVGPLFDVAALNEPFDLTERLRADHPKLIGLNMYPLNDAEAATLAAARFYAHNNNRDPLLYLTVSTGVGGDVAIDYETLSHRVHILAEVGYTPLLQRDGKTYETLYIKSSPPLTFLDPYTFFSGFSGTT